MGTLITLWCPQATDILRRESVSEIPQEKGVRGKRRVLDLYRNCCRQGYENQSEIFKTINCETHVLNKYFTFKEMLKMVTSYTVIDLMKRMSWIGSQDKANIIATKVTSTF